MKWIEPGNGGKGIMLNLSALKSMRMHDDRFIRFDEFYIGMLDGLSTMEHINLLEELNTILTGATLCA